MTSVTLQRKGNYKNLIIGYLNTNSIRNKFELIAETIKDFDVFAIPESKLDSTFSSSQFKITGFKIFRYDRKTVLLFSSNIELITVEFRQEKRIDGFPYVIINLPSKIIRSL